MALKNQKGNYLKITSAQYDAVTGICKYDNTLYETEQQRIDGPNEFQQTQNIGGNCIIDRSAKDLEGKELGNYILTQIYLSMKADSYSDWTDC